jgi:hypothetical protein
MASEFEAGKDERAKECPKQGGYLSGNLRSSVFIKTMNHSARHFDDRRNL